MTGIVERLFEASLRGPDKARCDLFREAKAEIERLESCLYAQEAVPPLYAEIKRLRAALQDIVEDPYAVDGGAAEIARQALGPAPMTEPGGVSVELLQIERDTCDRIRASNDQLRADIERLREERTALKTRIDSRLNNYLCEMKPGYDDSIFGFNEAWDIVRKALEPTP